MSYLEKSPKRRRINLSLKDKNKKTKQRKLQKTETTNSQLITKANIKKACLKVSTEAFQDYKKRFQLSYIPECIDNNCHHGHITANIKQISRSAEQSFQTEFKNKSWYEALEICAVCITSRNYLSANVLKNMVQIMMNSHEDLDSGYTIECILRKCQYILMMHFNMHPPCVAKEIRTCYKDFLTSPMEPKELSKKKKVTKKLSDEEIVSLCLSRLMYEISMESKDDTIIEQQVIPTDIEGVQLIYWKKQNLELYELLGRTERIERCMLVLESLIYLIQTDLALWDARCSSSRSSVRSQRPLLAYLLWQYNSFGTVSPACCKIMKLFAYFIHLKYPERHIKTMGLWLNAVVQMFYIYSTQSGIDYPNRGKCVADFSKEFYKIIASLPNSSISRILEKIQPSFMQYLIGLHHTQHILNTTKEDILNIIIWCFNTLSWENYCIGDQELIKYNKAILKPGKLMSYLSGKCQSLNFPLLVVQDAYPKFELLFNSQNSTETCQNHIIDTLFTTFVAYLEAYSVKNFNQTLNRYNENEIECDFTSNKAVSDNFVNKYTSIMKSYQDLLEILNEKQCDEPLQKLSVLINNYIV